MKIGFGQAEITPKGGKVSLQGQFHLRITEEIHDPLNAVAMVIQSDKARTVWVGCDLIELHAVNSRMAFEEAKKLVPDLKEEELVLTTTHIHTGPTMLANTYLSLTGDSTEPEGVLSAMECSRQVAAGIAKAVREAVDNLCEARAELAVARVRTGASRRTCYRDGHAQMYGNPYDPEFLMMEGREGGPSQLLYVYKAGTQDLMGVVANVPCTAQCDEQACYMTADYWGVARDIVTKEWGSDVRILPLCRTSGDLSPHELVDRVPAERDSGCYASGRKCALFMGGIVADAILEHKNRIMAAYEGDVFHAQGMKELDFPIWQVTEDEYKQACDYFKNPANFDGEGKPLDAFANANAHTRKKRVESGDKTYRNRLYAACLGDIVFLAFPFELYVEYGERIRMGLGQNVVFDVQLSYDNMGYLPTPRAVRGGHYSANIFNCICAPDGGEMLINESIKFAKELMNK